MRHLDLFAGIGGFSLAASWVWPEHKTVAFCEKDEFCQKVLKKHWPDVPVIADIRNLTKDKLNEKGDPELSGGDQGDTVVDLLTGGFP